MLIKLTLRRYIIVSFLIAVLFMVIAFITIGRYSVNKSFGFYVQKGHEKNTHKLISELQNHYLLYKNFDNFNWGTIENEAAKQSEYYRLTLVDGEVVYSNEDKWQPCCSSDDHKYITSDYAIFYQDKAVATLHTGYFSHHLFSMEEIAYREELKTAVIIALIVAALVAFVLLGFFVRQIYRSVMKIKNTTDGISRGDINLRLKGDSNIVEVNELADSVNSIGNNLCKQEMLKKQLVSDISHDLRTPVNTILNSLDAMIDGILPMKIENVKGMRAEITRLTSLIENIEKLTTLDYSSIVFKLQPVDISTMLNSVINSYEQIFIIKNIQFIKDIPDNVIISADKLGLLQAIGNLVSNAEKYTPENGFIEITLSREIDSWVLSVRNTPTVIDANDIPYIFERFYRAEKSRSSKINGSGLGLAIVQQIVSKHGWKIQVKSETELGTLFQIFIPDIQK